MFSRQNILFLSFPPAETKGVYEVHTKIARKKKGLRLLVLGVLEAVGTDQWHTFFFFLPPFNFWFNF